MRITIIIPLYNEEKTIEILLNKVFKIKINKQIIIVDDCSTDKSGQILRAIKKRDNMVKIFHRENKGKGGCIISAIPYITGDYVMIQDADLEYDPQDYYKFIEMAQSKSCKVIYGSRVLGRKNIQLTFFKISRIFFNFILTKISNIINNQKLTDAHTCYKFIDSKIFKKIKLQQNDFSICPEITSKLSKLGVRIYELPIKYKGRDYSDGKKIQIKDGFKAIFTLLKVRFLS
jgi:glycosyltransferase involved in cell wall biosynthesis